MNDKSLNIFLAFFTGLIAIVTFSIVLDRKRKDKEFPKFRGVEADKENLKKDLKNIHNDMRIAEKKLLKSAK